jgi:hypothetical protein
LIQTLPSFVIIISFDSTILTIVRTRKTTIAKAISVEQSSFSIIWSDLLETALIEIIRRYIKGGKLADNIFKKVDFASIAVELQPAYVSLNISPATNIIAGSQIKAKIDWVSTPSASSKFY